MEKNLFHTSEGEKSHLVCKGKEIKRKYFTQGKNQFEKKFKVNMKLNLDTLGKNDYTLR